MTSAVFIARRRWLAQETSRLDASCYASGGIEARDAITNADLPWAPIGELADVFLPPRFVRRFVRDPSRGTPLLSSSDILLSDFVGLPLLSTRATPLLSELMVERCASLVTRSGTIGRIAYVRNEMAAMAVSEHAIRVVPRDGAIRPGYLFAFLSSRPAQAMIQQRTYGSVVQHIEPLHVADVPMPLADDPVQKRIDSLVDAAASARTEAATLLDQAAEYFDSLAGRMSSRHDHALAAGTVRARTLAGRLDAFHHVGWAVESGGAEGDPIAEIADVISTNRVPRVYTERGIPFLSGIDVFAIRPMPRVRIAKWVADRFAAYVRSGDLAVQGSGQRYGLVGRVAYVGERLDGWAASHDLFRIRASDPMTRARIFAYCRSDSGHRAMLRHSYGTSIPHVNPMGISALRIPDLPPALSGKAVRALALRDQADRDEEQAIRAVEEWLA
jgi:type I restriction enzyme S subunit